jgi:hypothetical protein
MVRSFWEVLHQVNSAIPQHHEVRGLGWDNSFHALCRSFYYSAPERTFELWIRLSTSCQKHFPPYIAAGESWPEVVRRIIAGEVQDVPS